MSAGLHSLATIIKRLEAATARVEDVALASGFRVANLQEDGSSDNRSSYQAAAPPPPPPVMSEVPRSIAAYDDAVLNGKVKPFVELTRSFASPAVIEASGLVEKQFEDLRDVLLTAAACQKPDDITFATLISEFEPTIAAITRLRESNRKDIAWSNHLAALSDGAPTLGWVAMPTPGPYIIGFKDGVDFFGNKIRKEYRDKDPKHVEWVKAYVAIIEELRKYVHEHHTTGLTWNAKGSTVAEHLANKSKGGAPAPPPPPPPPPPPATIPPAPAAAGGTAAVFAELNKGADITKGLRSVAKSQMTHKNPELRLSSVVPSASPAPKKPLKPSKPQALMGKKPPKFSQEGKAWQIEYQENERNLIVDQAELNQVVNIFGCKNSTIQVKGKVNAVTLVNCEKTSVLVDSVVSSVSITKSPSFALQITGTAPMIQLDSNDSGQIYLSKKSLSAEITTAKCSSINVSLPVEGEEEGVFVEQAVPEMFKTVVVNGKLVTTVVEHAG